jgi:hypothetical protein
MRGGSNFGRVVFIGGFLNERNDTSLVLMVMNLHGLSHESLSFTQLYRY